jgi:hypothetical protein
MWVLTDVTPPPLYIQLHTHRCAKQIARQPCPYMIYTTIRHFYSQHWLASTTCLPAASLCPETCQYLVQWDRSHLLLHVEISHWKKERNQGNILGLSWLSYRFVVYLKTLFRWLRLYSVEWRANKRMMNWKAVERKRSWPNYKMKWQHLHGEAKKNYE